MNKLFMGICLILTCISAVLLGYNLTSGTLIETKWADVEWGVVALSPYSNMWTSGPVIEHFYFDKGTTVHINFSFGTYHTSDAHIVDFFIADEVNYLKWENQQTTKKYLLTEKTNTLDVNWTTPHEATWYFVWDTTTHDTPVTDLRVELVHFELLPFGDKIIIDRRPAIIILSLTLEIGIFGIAYGLYSKNKSRAQNSQSTFDQNGSVNHALEVGMGIEPI